MTSMPRTLRPTDPDYTRPRFTPSQAAVYLNRCRRTVYRLLRDKQIAYFQPGGHGPITLAQSDLDGYLQSLRQEAVGTRTTRRPMPEAVTPAYARLPVVRRPRFLQ